MFMYYLPIKKEALKTQKNVGLTPPQELNMALTGLNKPNRSHEIAYSALFL
jgi:hypothetical protein